MSLSTIVIHNLISVTFIGALLFLNQKKIFWVSQLNFKNTWKCTSKHLYTFMVRNACKSLVGDPDRKTLLGDLGVDGGIILRLILRKWCVMMWNKMRSSGCSFEHSNETFVSVKGREFLDWLSDYWQFSMELVITCQLTMNIWDRFIHIQNSWFWKRVPLFCHQYGRTFTAEWCKFWKASRCDVILQLLIIVTQWLTLFIFPVPVGQLLPRGLWGEPTQRDFLFLELVSGVQAHVWCFKVSVLKVTTLAHCFITKSVGQTWKRDEPIAYKVICI